MLPVPKTIQNLFNNLKRHHTLLRDGLIECRGDRCEGTYKPAEDEEVLSFVCVMCQETSCLRCDVIHKDGETFETWAEANADHVASQAKTKEANEVRVADTVAMDQ